MGWAGLLVVCAMSALAHPLGNPPGAMPGEMIDVQSTRMHLCCKGHGAPAVRLDAPVLDAINDTRPRQHADVPLVPAARRFDGVIANAVWWRDSLGVRGAGKLAPASIALQ